MEMIKVVLLAVVLMAIVMIGLAAKILLRRGGKFPNTHVSGNKYLKKNGVYCSQTQDKLEQREARKKIDYKNVSVIKEK
jgi:hypothetical protein